LGFSIRKRFDGGGYQKVNTFWESVLKAYNVLKDQHDEYQERQEQKSQFRKQNLKHAVQNIGILEDDSDVVVEVVKLPTRNVGSLQQKWSKKVQPLVLKFIGVTVRYPKRSGEDQEAYYNRVHLIFLRENEGEKSFAVYRPSWEYLKDTPKFMVLCSLPGSKKKEVINITETEIDNVSDIEATKEPMEKTKPSRLVLSPI